jgi:ABC-type glycerol-3-phosphate transport system permease component
VAVNAAGLGGAVVTVAPIVWMISTAFKPRTGLVATSVFSFIYAWTELRAPARARGHDQPKVKHWVRSDRALFPSRGGNGAPSAW